MTSPLRRRSRRIWIWLCLGVLAMAAVLIGGVVSGGWLVDPWDFGEAW
jgi:hypothetical protein|tara:strand:- start:370 stop:513 length:144 start_codon:yes stop_codon:yes gene_type:complete